jgi:hypothetical protein
MTGCDLKERSGDRIQVGRDFLHPSKKVLESIQPPTQLVLRRSRR